MLQVSPRKIKKPSAQPGYAGAYEESERQVDNPYALTPDPLRDPDDVPEPKTQIVRVNLRETPVEHMWSRGLISREEKAAADWFRERREAARLGGGVIDPARIRVDSSVSNIAIDRMVQAHKDLGVARKHLGRMDYDMLAEACDVGRSLSDLAKRWYGLQPGSRQEREMTLHVGRRVRDALAVLVQALVRGKGKRKPSRTHYRSFGGLTADMRDWDADPPTDAETALLARMGRRRRRKRK